MRITRTISFDFDAKKSRKLLPMGYPKIWKEISEWDDERVLLESMRFALRTYGIREVEIERSENE